MTTPKHTGHIHIEALGQDDAGFIYVGCHVEDEAGRRRVVIPLHNLAKLGPADTSALRVVDAAARSELQRRVQAMAGEAPTFRVITRPGWHGARFVYPDGSYTMDAGLRRPVVRLPDMHRKFADKFLADGDIAAWHEIVRLGEGNPIVILAVGVACSGPLVDLYGLEAPAIQIVDSRTGVGKSSIVEAAGAFWGGRDRGSYAESWKQTPGHFELLAKVHAGTVLVLDDLRTFRFKQYGFEGFDEALMCFANGAGAGRLTETDAIAMWSTPLLSTSNTMLEEIAARYGVEVDDALRLRLMDIPLPTEAGGAFQNLHGFATHAALGIEFRRLAPLARGAAGHRYILDLESLRRQDDAELGRYFMGERARYRSAAVRQIPSCTRDLARFHERFASIYASLAIAKRLGVVTWSLREVFDATLVCARAHCDLVASFTSGSLRFGAANALELLKAHVREHRNRFVVIGHPIRDPAHDHRTCLGYVGDHQGQEEYCFSEAKWQDICGREAARAKGTLLGLNMLHADAGRPSTRRVLHVNSERRREQVIAVKASFFSIA